MKKKTLLKTMLLLCALVVGTSSVWAETEFEFNLNELYQNGTKVTAKTVISESNGTLSFTDENENFTILLTRKSGNQPGFYTSSGYFRFYSNDTFKLTAAEGITMTKIVITANGTSFSLSSQDGLNTSTKTWTGSASEVTFTGTGTNKWDKITITYTTSGGGTPIPTLSVSPASIDFGEKAVNGSYQETFTVTYDNLTEDLTVSVGSGLTGVSVSPTTISIDGDGTEEITVTYAPNAEGSISGDITISNTADGLSKTVSVEGSASVMKDYQLYEAALTEGDYIIYYNGYAMENTISSERLGYASVTPTNDVISTSNSAIVWHIAPSGDYWTIYNESVQEYAASTGVKNKAQLLDDGTDDKSLWTVTGSETFEFVNKQNTTNGVNANLRNNGTYGFACYAESTGGALSLYKLVSNDPTITVSTSSLAVPNYVAGTTEPEYEILTVNGSNLTADITLSLDENSNFEMSTDLETWSSSLTLIQSDGSVTDEEVAVRMKAGLAKGEYEGSITLSSTGATDATVSLSGTVTSQLYAIEQYRLPETANGTITFSPESPIEEGSEVTLTATPAAGYDFTADSWVFYKQSGEEIVEDNSITVTNNKFTMPSYDIWVDATFTAKQTYAVTCNYDETKGLLEATPTAAYEGQKVTLNYAAEDGYELKSIVITKTSDGLDTNITPTSLGNDKYTFTMPGYAVTATATFTLPSATITFGSAQGSTNINSASVTGNDSKGNTWTVTTEGTTSFNPYGGYAQVGSSNNPATSITFTTTLPAKSNITAFEAKFGGFNNTAGDITLKVNDVTVGTGSLSGASDATVTQLNSSDADGKVLTVTVTNISKGVKCYYISYSYETLTTATSFTISSACTDGSKYYGTFSSERAFVVPEGLTVSEIGVENDALQVSDYTTGEVVPANTGVMVSSTTAGKKTVTYSSEEGTPKLGDNNCLRPSGDAGITADAMAAANANCLFYRLTMHDGTAIGFWWGAEDGDPFSVAGSKAYLAVPQAKARFAGFSLFGGEATGVKELKNSRIEGLKSVYNLNGQRVMKPTKGLYIKDGKKMFIK